LSRYPHLLSFYPLVRPLYLIPFVQLIATPLAQPNRPLLFHIQQSTQTEE
jgi:hypothetical protein